MNIPREILKKDIDRMTNQIWKLIPMKENGEDWFTQLETVIIELTGLTKVINEPYLILLSKLNGLKELEVTFEMYRKTVFECISLLREI